MVVTTVYGLQLFLFLGAGYFSFTASQDDVLRLDDDNRDLKRLLCGSRLKKSRIFCGQENSFCTFGIEFCYFLAADSGSQRARRRGRLRVLRDLGSPPLATQRSFRNLARKILKRLSADCPSSNDWSNRIKASSSITDVCLGLLSLWGGPLPSL